MSQEYQDYCNANFGPKDNPAREEWESNVRVRLSDIRVRLHKAAFGPLHERSTLLLCSAIDEIERLTLENWQLKDALGYPVPGDIPQGEFKCGLCEARAMNIHHGGNGS